MNRIKALPKSTAERIASGEVIERPLSVVKELLENSIDAGSDYITVEIKKGGKEYIRVSDNGSGISKDDVILAFTRFATSKIYEYEDLESISTLGFRGVALSSIAAVSRAEMYTKTADEKVGSRFVIEGGDKGSLSPAACEEGTTIVVRDLFFNTPARLNFLKSDNQEAALVSDYVSKMAVAYPDRKIRLISNGTVLFSTNGKSDLKQAILTVYSRSLTEGLTAIDAADGSMKLTGFVSSPSEARKSRKYQIFYVNRRWVKCKALERALDEAFHDRLFDGFYPNAFLFLEVDPSQVDVNLLPNKTELRFFDEDAVIIFAANAIRKAITAPVSMPKAEFKEAVSEPNPVEFQSENKGTYSVFERQCTYTTPEKDYVNPIESSNATEDFFKSLREEKNNEQISMDNTWEVLPESGEFHFSSLEIVGQVFASYIICKDDSTMYLFDQHAAHERIMFEHLLKQFDSQEKVVQPLLVPIVIQLTAAEKQAAGERLDILAGLGFELEEFGPTEYAVKAVPASLDEAEASDFINNVLEVESLSRHEKLLKYDEIISNACKAAVKANNRLSNAEIAKLLADLESCDNPYSCPHGRPTFLKLTVYDIERLFKRK